MSELGQHLKEVREQKQISLDDLQRTTKIQKRYLLAIEEGRFDTLPGLFYARAFVKTYAEAIGLDPEPLFDQFRDELPNPQKEAVELPSRSERTRASSIPRKKRRVTSFLPALIGFAFIVILVVGIWLVAQWGSEQESEVVAPDETKNLDADFSEDVGEVPLDEDETEGESEPIEEVGPSEEDVAEPEPVSTLSFVETIGTTSYYEIAGTEAFEATLQFNGVSYVDIKNGKGKTFYSGQPGAGEVITDNYSGEEEIIFNLGASQNVTLTINGDEVEFPLNVAHQKVNVRSASVGE